MSLTLKEKQAVVAEVREVAANSQTAVAAEYIGLTVAQMTTLRAKARESGVYLRVVKNTLARLAVDGTDFACLKGSLTGPLLLVFSGEDPGAGARLVRDFAKDNAKLVVLGGAMGAAALDAAGVKAVAAMPSREEVIASIAACIGSPASNIAGAIGAPASNIAGILSTLEEREAA